LRRSEVSIAQARKAPSQFRPCGWLYQRVFPAFQSLKREKFFLTMRRENVM